jgi:hypothetical protein
LSAFIDDLQDASLVLQIEVGAVSLALHAGLTGVGHLLQVTGQYFTYGANQLALQ